MTVAAVVASACSSHTDSPTPPSESPSDISTSDTAAEQCDGLTDLLHGNVSAFAACGVSGLFNHAVGQMEGWVDKTAEGWVLGVLGIGGDDEAAIAEMVKQLAAIEETLTQIETQLTSIDAEIALLTKIVTKDFCDLEGVMSASAMTLLSDWWQQYQLIVTRKQQGLDVTQADIEKLVNGILDEDAGVEQQVGVIHSILVDHNTIQDCGEYALYKMGDSGETASNLDSYGDVNYAKAMGLIVDKYVSWQAIGLLLASEAYHWQAAQAYQAANPGTDVDYANLCSTTASGPQSDLCANLALVQKDFQGYIVDELLARGLSVGAAGNLILRADRSSEGAAPTGYDVMVTNPLVFPGKGGACDLSDPPHWPDSKFENDTSRWSPWDQGKVMLFRSISYGYPEDLYEYTVAAFGGSVVEPTCGAVSAADALWTSATTFSGFDGWTQATIDDLRAIRVAGAVAADSGGGRFCDRLANSHFDLWTAKSTLA